MQVLQSICLFLFVIYSTAFPVAAKELNVLYSPSPVSKDDNRFDYSISLLRKVLEKTVDSHGDYNLHPAEKMNVGRAIQFLKSGTTNTVNVIWTTSSESREQSLLPIRIPIRKGLLGYRIFLINKEDQAKFSKIQTVDELKELRVGQGHIWNDVNVFKDNDFEVVTGPIYEGLFRMLVEKRFDYFSRGINEAPAEYESRKDRYPSLHIEDSILLYYPWPKYFFTSKKSPEIAERIEYGLKMMIQDGSFDELFFQYHRDDIERANLQKRKLFTIINPLLPKTAPLEHKGLWFDPVHLVN
jgi:hypothetical protein